MLWWEAILLAVPLALTWMVVTGQPNLGGFFVGYLLSVLVLRLLKSQPVDLSARKLPGQLWALLVYSLTLTRDIWLSSIDVTRRVLARQMPLKPGIIAVPTQDANQSEAVAAFSAHGITITPGELVVDFEGKHTMFVHCLDVDASSASAAAAQSERLRLLNRIFGR
ncbi:MAG: Na+/H+ antiporter subunit E [Chloroflexi bacterium]|nr:Na+/H+ antiporter subunit E [Chloroflexota bacterium]